jgi:hypothetical protein
MKLDSEKRARLAKLIRLLGSDNAGEVAAAAHKLQAVLRSSGGDLHDLAALLEDEQLAAMHDRSGQAGWTHDAPGPPPPPPPRRQRRHSTFFSDRKFKIVTASILAVVAVAGAGLMMRGSADREPQFVSTASAPSPSPAAPKFAAHAPAPVEVKIAPPPPPKIEAKQASPTSPSTQVKQNLPPPATIEMKQDAPPPPPVEVRQDSPQRTVEPVKDLPKLSPTAPKAKPIMARSEPTTADPSEARNAARSAVGEIIRQIRFPQRIDRAITMVSVGAYGSQIVASYRTAEPANAMGEGALRRLAVDTACGLPNLVSALNRGATHRARYTDPDGAVTEVVVGAQDCDY